MVGHDQLARRFADDFFNRHAGSPFLEDKGAVLDFQVGQVGQHALDAASTGEGQGAVVK